MCSRVDPRKKRKFLEGMFTQDWPVFGSPGNPAIRIATRSGAVKGMDIQMLERGGIGW
jgi:hypothetical protein